MPIWNPRLETMSRVDLEQLQLERLQAVVNRIWDSVAFYRRRFEQGGLIPERIRSLDDLRLLPLTVKDDLRVQFFRVGRKDETHRPDVALVWWVAFHSTHSTHAGSDRRDAGLAALAPPPLTGPEPSW